MSWGYGYGRWMGWAPAMTVGARKAKVKRTLAEYRKEGKSISPVEIQGRTIARTFWGKAWCDNIESYRDYAYRLERGRSYVRSGAVIDLQIGEGAVTALVIGSGEKPYRVSVRIDPMRPDDWKALVQRAAGRVSSLFALAQGQLPEELLQDFCNPETGLFPKPREIHFDCSCPDGASCCKHVAAVLYGIGARLDKKPELFFTLRGIDPDSIVSDEVVETLTEGASNELENADLSDVFGISLDADASAPLPPPPASKPPRRPTPKAPPPKPVHKASPKAKPSPGKAKPDCAARIKALRTRLGLSQTALAKRLGTYQVAVSLWERGKATPPPRILAALLENNQTPEGIRIPKALQPYTGFDIIS